jgi:hypothetical protein
LRRKAGEKIGELRKFWRTRTLVFQDLTLVDRTSEELGAGGYLTAWKFNLIQSCFAALPALLLKKIMDFWLPSAKSQGAEAQVDAVFSWLWPIVVPFILFLMARMIAWGSIKRIHSSPEHRKRAARAYLYLDGAYGLYPQTLLSTLLCSVRLALSCPRSKPSQGRRRIVWRAEMRSQASAIPPEPFSSLPPGFGRESSNG